MNARRILVLILIIVLTVSLIGCAQLGPKAIEASRTDYNIAMHRTEEEQSLLNLVRLRYGDRPYFLEATALNTQFSISPSVDARATLNPDSADIVNLGGRLAFEEKPTISYSPLTGEAFVRQVLSRISIETLLLLDASGWKTDRVLRLGVEKINSLDNAARASGPTPSVGSDVAPFLRAIALLSNFQDQNELRFARKTANEKTEYVALFADSATHTAEFQELASLLDLDPMLGEYKLAANTVKTAKDTISLSTRSFMGVLYFLSQGVVVPEEHVSAGLVALTKNPSGSLYDWEQVTSGLLAVRSSKQQESLTNVSVQYRGHWFFIDDTDIQSKSTFALLGQLYALQSKSNESAAPVLTLPLGN
ncbi:MAG: hypothetical protein AAF387_21810 [Pseudomonadota bacterium]